MGKIIAQIFCLWLLSKNANAYDLTKKLGIGFSSGYSAPLWGNDFNKTSDGDFGYGVYGRYFFTSTFYTEAAVTRSEFDGTSKNFDNINALAIWRLKKENDLTPILGLGLGFTRIRHFGSKSIKLAGLGRAGLEYNVSPWFSVGAFVDYQYVTKFMGEMQGGRAHVLTSGGALTWYFGGSSFSKKTPATASVSESFIDESHLDSDDDGVFDPDDKCPSTQKNQNVNSIGCQKEEEASIPIDIEFKKNQSEIPVEHKKKIEEINVYLNKHPDIYMRIESRIEKRAKAIMNALVKLGINKSRLTTRGFGAEKITGDNETVAFLFSP